ncbi:nucleotidyltransferase family protein [Janibacter hoylei]|uniref:nucleotidyltransferase family protein n=1 Tax=Janibacter hoylei TaxID=364298 RepID=UPI00237932AB|nr:nucleotidyltransferase family protein [Janibacter hoylei]
MKGPAFAQLGVRSAKSSNDFDLMIHPDDRPKATQALAEVGWRVVSYWFPPELDDIVYSTTFRHQHFPTTMDLHHTFSGFLDAPGAFDALWVERSTVTIAHQPVLTTSAPHALVIEALNHLKVTPQESWPVTAERILADASPFAGDEILAAARSVGAVWTVGAVLDQLGVDPPEGPVPESAERWRAEAGADNTRRLIKHLVRRAPRHLPRVVWQQLTLSEEIARFWASAQDVEYRSPRQILAVRVRRLVGK